MKNTNSKIDAKTESFAEKGKVISNDNIINNITPSTKEKVDALLVQNESLEPVVNAYSESELIKIVESSAYETERDEKYNTSFYIAATKRILSEATQDRIYDYMEQLLPVQEVRALVWEYIQTHTWAPNQLRYFRERLAYKDKGDEKYTKYSIYLINKFLDSKPTVKELASLQMGKKQEFLPIKLIRRYIDYALQSDDIPTILYAAIVVRNGLEHKDGYSIEEKTQLTEIAKKIIAKVKLQGNDDSLHYLKADFPDLV